MIALLTGGTGSLGRAITKQLLAEGKFDKIRIFARNEFLHNEMRRQFIDSRLRYIIGDIRDRDAVDFAMNDTSLVIHCAAMKHVDICETDPVDAVKTNIYGSVNVLTAAVRHQVDKVMCISSDKAVHPISVYGATKLLLEKLTVLANRTSGKTNLSCVRLGNLEESSGSFLSMLYNLKPEDEILITDQEMTRYWMGLDKAAEFTIQCIERMQGGEIFIPKIQERAIMDFVEAACGKDARIKVIGKRPGEKLHEQLFSEDESPIDCGDYFVIKP